MSLAVPPDVLVSTTGGRTFLTKTSSGRLYEANETALAVFEAARASGAPDACAKALHARYPDVPWDEIARDVRAVLDEMLARGLLVAASSEA